MPAFNAEATLRATLDSVLAQTYRSFEVVVVDDGSTDRTAAIAEALAAMDGRIRVLQKPNGGVASARNLGIRHARGALIAPLDADDLWHSEKLAKQVTAMEQSGPRLVGLVYAWSRAIDETGRILKPAASTGRFEGDVYAALVLHNLLGNASSPLIRRACLEEVGGYDPGMREGCEDWQLYLALAERYDFAVVPEFLVGYRQTLGSMSRDVHKMLRSHRLLLAEARRRHPELPARLFRWAEGNYSYWLAADCVRQGQFTQALALSIRALCKDPAFVMRPWPYVTALRILAASVGLSRCGPFAVGKCSRVPRPPAGDVVPLAELTGKPFLDAAPDIGTLAVTDDDWYERRWRAVASSLRLRPTASV